MPIRHIHNYRTASDCEWNFSLLQNKKHKELLRGAAEGVLPVVGHFAEDNSVMY
jgi:hypothetical protein